MRKNLINYVKAVFTLTLSLLVINMTATNYYVSNNGNDGAAGISSATAWKTITKVNSRTLSPGDSVLFQAGGTWKDELIINESGSPGNFIVFSRYGTGPNPKILGSETAENWTATGTANVWRSGTPLTNYSNEYYPGRIFFIKDDSVSWGQHKSYNASFSNLTGEYDYTVSGTTYYVYAASDPDTRYDSIEVTQRESCITIPDNDPQSYLVVDGIDFKFSRMWGFNAGYPAQRGATDLIFRNCNIGYIGAQPSGAAYGISVWHSNLLVENCLITDCGRRGVSVNLYLEMPHGEQRHLKNIIIRNNVFKRGYHTTALDLSSQQTQSDTIENVYFYNNIVDDSDFDEICDNCGSNQVFFQNGESPSLNNNIYVVGNIFVQSTARNILFEGIDTSYVWNNTIVGHNPNITENPYANVVWNSDNAISYYRNNILYDNLPNNSMQNHGVFIYSTYTTVFGEKDYNSYYSLHPKTDRNFSAHRVNSTGGMGYWNTNEWNDYLSENSKFEHHSPAPQNPKFVNYDNKDFHLTSTSAAVGSGLATSWVVVTDPFGQKDTINKYDYEGKAYSIGKWDMGALAYSLPDITATDIISFSIPQQTGTATINKAGHTVNIEVPFGTLVTSLTPTIEVSQGASISPKSGIAQNFTGSVNYTVTALDELTQQIWTVTVTVLAGSTDTDITGFTLTQQTGAATINNTNHTVAIEVETGTDVTNLTPSITLSSGASINPESGTERNFSNPVTYTVTAQNGVSNQNWTVTVSLAPAPAINNEPVIDVNYESSIYKGFVYSLDASESYDLDQEPLSFNWEVPSDISVSSISGPVISILPKNNCDETAYSVSLSVSDGKDTVYNNFSINIQNFKPEVTEIEVISVEASDYEEGNPAANILDNNTETRWSASGDNQWITLELENESNLSHFGMIFYQGEIRSSFFEISASEDNENWELIFDNSSSCGFSPDVQVYEVPENLTSKTYKYLRLVGHMNSENEWNSYVEFIPYGYINSVNTGIDKEMGNEVKVYPNPATDYVYIQTQNESSIRIIDIMGKTIYEQNNVKELIRVNCDFQCGIYFLQIINDNKIIDTYKLVIQ